MTPPAPEWLARFQRDFSTTVRTPLDRSAGTVRATPAHYPQALVGASLPGPNSGAAERLAVYNQQYWYRLFRVLQAEWPLTAGLMGAWAFNGECATFLSDNPPRARELVRAADGLGQFLVARHGAEGTPLRRGQRLPGEAIAAAVGIDDGFRTVFGASEPSADETLAVQQAVARAGGELRLRSSGRFVLVEEHWPLLALRQRIVAEPDKFTAAVPLPRRWSSPRFAVIHRYPGGASAMPLEVPQAILYRALTSTTLSESLAHLETQAGMAGDADLGRRVRDWMAVSLRLGFWDGAVPC